MRSGGSRKKTVARTAVLAISTMSFSRHTARGTFVPRHDVGYRFPTRRHEGSEIVHSPHQDLIETIRKKIAHHPENRPRRE